MTDKLYLHSDDLTGTTSVLKCTPAENGYFNLELSATLFHPQGGGQPGDTGTIGPAIVSGVIQQADRIVHVTDRPLAPGEWPVAVDPLRRERHTRMHSAGHLIAAVVEQSGWRAIKANHRPGEGRVVFETGLSVPDAPTVEQVTAAAENLIARDLPRHQATKEGIRTVTWGSLPAYACGGTHVVSTRAIGGFTIASIKMKKGTLSVSYDIL